MTKYSHDFIIDDKVQVAKRIRYNIWMALSDLGGLHDGIFVVINIIIGPLVATAFENDLLRGSIFDWQLTAIDSQKRKNLAKLLNDEVH